jgi:hypothetical protein
MKVLVNVLIALAVAFVGFKVFVHWEKVKEKRVLEERAERGADIDPDQLPGLPQHLRDKVREVQQHGDPAVFKRFIDACKNYPDVKDPRLAWMELDYVVAISAINPIEAKKIFRAVKKRTPPDSPIMPRIRLMEKNYE